MRMRLAQTATCTIAVNVAPPAASVKIRDIQGSAHISPRNGQSVSGVPGIVTGVKSNGFFLQDPTPDANEATSEGIFVFTNSAPTVSVGDSVQVSGTVQEFRAGGSDGLSNLTITEIVSPGVTLVSSGNALPAPIVLGAGGRAIPKNVIDDDATGSVETSGTFNAATDAIDFYESLEGMRVRINNAVAVGPTNSFGEIAVLADNGVGSTLRTPRGGIVINATDFNPERIILDDALMSVPSVNVGDSFGLGDGGGRLRLRQLQVRYHQPRSRRSSGGLTAETTSLVGSPTQLTVASFNVENLAANNPPAKFAALAGQIVNALKKPRHRCPDGNPGQQRCYGQRRGRCDSDGQHVDRGDPGGRRPELPVPQHQSGERSGRWRAGWQHPRRLPVQSGACAVRGSGGRWPDDLRRRS